jgi:hypothetical protein
MTARRLPRKQVLRLAGRPAGSILAIGICLLLTGGVFASRLHAATTERVVTDQQTGLAIYGVDPVAYFTNRKPTVGRAEFEYRFAGAIWRFGNEGNRAAFAADPDVYMPRFGGYDPIGIARGVATPGYPEIWALFKDRLYLFYTREARAAFIADSATATTAAEARWPEVMQGLAQ